MATSHQRCQTIWSPGNVRKPLTQTTSSGNFITAVDGGGVSATANAPFATDRTAASTWETFQLTKVQEVGAQESANFTFSLDSFQVRNTRSGNILGTSKDTDYVSLSVTVGNNPVNTVTKSMGDVGKGTFPTNLSVPNVNVAFTDAVILTYTIVNSSQGEEKATAYLQQVAEKISAAGLTALAGLATAASGFLGAAIGAALGTAAVPLIGSAIGVLVGFLVASFWGVAFPDCDGPVASAVHVFSGAYLQAQTSGGIKWSTSEDNPGVNSPGGCGSNSDYGVTWSVSLS